VYFEVKV